MLASSCLSEDVGCRPSLLERIAWLGTQQRTGRVARYSRVIPVDDGLDHVNVGVTKRLWDEILAGSYVAQAFVPPSEGVIHDDETQLALKVDLRNYAYSGAVQFVVARLYQGQTTNSCTPSAVSRPVLNRTVVVC